MTGSSSCHHRLRSAAARGFTLVELVVVLMIVAVLLTSALIPLSTQVALRAISDTQRTMDEIKEAIIGYAQANGRLPCPADGTIAAGSLNAGVEQYAANVCTTTFGVVPWTTLGVSEADAWGRRFSYRVSPAFADALPPATTTWQTTNPPSPATQSPPCTPSQNPTLSTFALCTLGDVAVFNPTDANKVVASTAIATNIPVIIISHGKNGYGAYQRSGIRVAGTNDADGNGVPDQNTHETANAIGTTTAIPTGGVASFAFYSRSITPETSTCNDTTAGVAFCEFDDVVAWISPSTLITRMVSAGRLP